MPYALERRASDSMAAASIESSQASCARGVTSPGTTAPAESPSMARSLLMRTSH